MNETGSTVMCTQSEGELPAVETKFIGETESMIKLKNLINRAAQIKRTTLIAGDTGTGKELVAKQLHQKSSLTQRPFVTVHCGAIQDSLIESELFGHKRGAFTGANESHEGLVAMADRGILFLDEVNSLSHAGQSKLLRFLETGEYRPVGSNRTKKADVWVISASNQDLYKQAHAGSFRLDLLYRLDMIRINVPPLRLRKKDILVLARHFLHRIGGNGRFFTDDALQALMQWQWPGNVRELKHRIEAASLLCEDHMIDARALGFGSEQQGLVSSQNENMSSDNLAKQLWKLIEANGLTLGETLSLCEELLIRQALNKESNNRTRAAARLGIHVRTIFKKLNKEYRHISDYNYIKTQSKVSHASDGLFGSNDMAGRRDAIIYN